MQVIKTLDDFHIRHTVRNSPSSMFKIKVATRANTTFHIKIFKKLDSLLQLQHQVRVLQAISNPSCPFIGVYLEPRIEAVYKSKSGQTKRCHALVFDNNAGGLLFDHLAITENKRFNEPLSRTYFKQLLLAIRHVQFKNYNHGSLELDSLFLGSDFSLRLTNFCKSQPLTSELSQGDINEALKILFTMVVGRPPFGGFVGDPYEKCFKNNRNKYWEMFEKKFKLSEQFKEFFGLALTQKWDINKIMNSTWWNQVDLTPEQLQNSMQDNLTRVHQNIELARQQRRADRNKRNAFTRQINESELEFKQECKNINDSIQGLPKKSRCNSKQILLCCTPGELIVTLRKIFTKCDRNWLADDQEQVESIDIDYHENGQIFINVEYEFNQQVITVTLNIYMKLLSSHLNSHVIVGFQETESYQNRLLAAIVRNQLAFLVEY